MKKIIIYDSTFGNTKLIADSISRGLEGAKVVSVSDFSFNDLEGVSLLAAGSPIIGWKPSEGMGRFLEGLKPGMLKGKKVAAFDTRVKLFIHGDAAKKILAKLEEAGGMVISSPQMFYVKGKEGPLFDGETKKAFTWGAELLEEMNK